MRGKRNEFNRGNAEERKTRNESFCASALPRFRDFLKMFGLFKKFKDGFAKTVSAIAAKTHGLFGGRKIDAASLDALEDALIMAEFCPSATRAILPDVQAAVQKDA